MSQPDGYTLLATPAGSLATNRFVFKKLLFDPGRFCRGDRACTGSFILDARRGLPISSLEELSQRP
jgi:hypothetical protein